MAMSRALEDASRQVLAMNIPQLRREYNADHLQKSIDIVLTDPGVV
jgi:hypothetical protein